MQSGESFIHKRLKRKVAEKLLSEGYNVELEKTLQGKRVDIYAENEDEIKIVEIIHTHDGSFPQVESNKRIRKIKIYTLNHFLNSKTPIISFSIVKPEHKQMIDELKQHGSFSEILIEAIEEYYNDTVLIPVNKEVESWLHNFRGTMTYSEFISLMISEYAKACLGTPFKC